MLLYISGINLYSIIVVMICICFKKLKSIVISRLFTLLFTLWFYCLLSVCTSGHPRELTEEERQQALHSEEFLIFFDSSIRVMERALAEDSNIFFDYSGRDLDDKEG